MPKLSNGSLSLLLCTILGIGSLIAVGYYTGINKYASLAFLQEQGLSLRIAVHQHYYMSMILYFFIFVTLITILPLVIPLTLMAGFLFGTVPGFFLSLNAATLGSVISYLVIRRYIGPSIHKRYESKLKDFEKKMHQHGASYLLTLNLMSAIPYILLDTLAALSNISLFTFIWTFALGNIPAIAILSYTGQELISIKSFNNIFTPTMLIGFGILAFIALLPLILKRFNCKF